MSAEIQQTPVTWQRLPCGPECRHAQPMPNTYGEWHWCTHPQIGSRVVRDGRECNYYEALATLADRTELSRRRG